MKDEVLANKIKELRNRNGFSQEELAEKTGLSLRTIQRIENGETEPRGDSLKRIAGTFGVSPDEITDWQIMEDKNVLTMLNLSQLSFIAFPLLGIIVPLTIWIIKKDKVKNVDSIGKAILNFQISWTLLLFLYYLVFIINMYIRYIPFSMISNLLIIGGLYAYNLILILKNTLQYIRKENVNYIPAIKILN